MTAVLYLAAAVVVLCLLALAVGLARAAGRPDPVDTAYHTLPAGRPAPPVDTVNGSHDRYPQMTDNTRDIVTAYCERMWHHTQEQP